MRIARDSPGAAESVIDRFYDLVRLFTDFPMVGVQRDDLEPGMRLWPVGNYVVLHRVEGRAVTIVRVVWGGRDLTALLRGT